MSVAAASLQQPSLRLRDADTEPAPRETTLHDRIHEVVARLSFRELAEATGLNAETVRRYVRGADPSVAFIRAFCDAFDLSAEWLLYGRGPRHRDAAVDHLLRSAGYARLLAALAERLEAGQRR